jgi:hypothetical protein
MSNFRGTRGKWEINPKASRNVRCNNLTIANCSSGQNGESEIEEKHNALLISKSPEMLEDLTDIVWLIEQGATLEELTERVIKSRQLIKEATEL